MIRYEVEKKIADLDEAYRSFTTHEFQFYLKGEVGDRLVMHRLGAVAIGISAEQRAHEASMHAAAMEYTSIPEIAYQRAKTRLQNELVMAKQEEIRREKHAEVLKNGPSGEADKTDGGKRSRRRRTNRF